ncbi:MAG: FCD domain [Rhodobacteraceae bacterium HLUCCA12]|nr:MAG: FCD domain [Rhodobacteraceae bacterium HLUCCA12]
MRHRLAAAIAPALALLMVLSGPLQAQSLREQAERIESALEAGETGDAMQAMREMHLSVADQAGFSLQQALLTEEPATGYGIYERREDAVYTPGDPVYGYVEPLGYSFEDGEVGLNAMLFDIDFALFTPEGERLTDVTPMGAVELTSHNRPLDAYFHLTYRISGPPGDYVIWTRVTDRPSGESAEFEIPISFRDTEGPSDKD